MKFTIDIKCRAPEWPIPDPVVFDDYRYFEARVTKEVEGRLYHCNFVTDKFPESDRDRRRLALDQLFSSINYSLRREQFPEDTLVYEEVERDGKTLYCNPKYPESK
jgi:hypothetical protein